MDCTSLKEWAQLASNVGFPIIVAAYVLVRLEKAIHGLSIALARVHMRIDQLERRP